MGWKDKLREKFKLDKDPIERLRKSENLTAVRRYVDTAVDMAKMLNDMGKEPTLRNYLALGMVGLSKLISLNEVDPHNDADFSQMGGDTESVNDFYHLLQALCKKKGKSQVFGEMRVRQVQVTEVYGETFIFEADLRKDESDWFFLAKDNEEDLGAHRAKVHAVLGRLIWEEYGPRIKMTVGKNDNPQFETWNDIEERLDSPTTDELIERIRWYRKEGIHRSILLNGPPGSGKTSMAHAIMDEFNLPTIFIEADTAKRIRTSTLRQAVRLLHPGMLIIDDFDQMNRSSDLLSLMVFLLRKIPLVIATSNNADSIHAGVTRPGRFSEKREVKRILTPSERFPDLPSQIADAVDDWEIAFVEELVTRVRVMRKHLDVDPEEMTRRIWLEYKSLHRRIKKNVVRLRGAVYDEDEENERVEEADEDLEDEEGGMKAFYKVKPAKKYKAKKGLSPEPLLSDEEEKMLEDMLREVRRKRDRDQEGEE